MAFKTFVDGVALPASDLNTYLMRQAVIVCTSGTRPSSPTEGMEIYETDTDRKLVYTTATTGWVRPWNMPWGIIAYKETTGAQTGIGTTLTTVTGLSDTSTYVANRRIKLSAYARLTQQTGTGTPELHLCEGATLFQRESTVVAAGTWTTQGPWVVITPTAGSHTFDVKLVTTNNTVDVSYSSTQKASFLIEDIGPNGAPA